MMNAPKKVKKKILVNSYVFKELGIINEEEYKNVVNQIQKKS